jgi:hypothetical protein
MLRPLRSSLGGFIPTKLAPGDPLAEIAAAWPRLVGEDVARSSRPRELRDGALVVVTRSSAWSHQLSFLAEEILARLRALPSSPAVSRLRFRVGRIAADAPPFRRIPRAAKARTALQAAPAQEARTAGEALQRFRAHVTEQQRVLRERGANLCSSCGVELETGSRCAPCGDAALRNRLESAQRIMYDSPWLGGTGTRDLVTGLTDDEYAAARRELLARWWSQLDRAGRAGRLSPDRREARIAGAYVLLHSGLEPGRITTAVVRNLLGDALHALVYATEETI